LNYAVILAGGKGERFWPLSRSSHPKQLLQITSDKTMFQETIDRISDLIPVENTLVVAGANIKDPLLKNVPSLKQENLITEPDSRNTCLAIGLAAAHIRRMNPNATMVVLSSDHYIRSRQKLIDVLKVAIDLANKGDYLITLGIVPTRAETAYGYIELAERLTSYEDISVFKINQFKEKPDRMTAQEYYYDRKHLWNSGMFVWRVAVILEALKKHMPDLYRKLETYSEEIGKKTQWEAAKKLYSQVEAISVDCAILETADNVITVKADLVWDDVGSWLALERIKDRDKHNNVILGKAELMNTYETTVVNDGEGIIAVLGLSDSVIVKTNDIVFVAHKTKVQDVKELIRRFALNKDLEKYL
jgi:mannose-1-phosphate guanylyltransferase